MKIILLCATLLIAVSIIQVNADGGGILNGGGDPFKKPAPAPKPAPKGNGSPKTPKKMVRVPIKNLEISPELVAISDRLMMEGDKKELTKKQANWIERFITTINNWLYLVHVVLKMDKFKELYREHLQQEFDMWITGRKNTPFDMIYRNELDPKEAPVHYKIIIYRISLSGLGYADFNLKSFEIGFERSKNKMTTPDGQSVYRKDRVYTLELEAELPVTDVKIKHEIVNGKEEGQFDELTHEDKQDVKLGYLRLRLSNVKMYVKVQLTEIDKRFVHEDPNTKETYYFERPQVFDFKFSIRDAMMFKPELQKKPGLQDGFVGKGLTEARARIILRDFVDFLVQKKYETELNDRLSMALLNRYSRSIMMAPDVLIIPLHLDEETAFYRTDLPTELDEDELVMAYKVFYMSYSMESFINACKHFLFKALEFQAYFEDETDESKLSEEELAEKKKKDAETEQKLMQLGNDAEKWMEDQATKAGKGLAIRDDGFDWDEDKPPKEKSSTEEAAAVSEVVGSNEKSEGKQPASHSSINNDLGEIEGKLKEFKIPPSDKTKV